MLRKLIVDSIFGSQIIIKASINPLVASDLLEGFHIEIILSVLAIDNNKSCAA